MNQKNITFKYQNGKDRLLLTIPSTNSYCRFQNNNQQRNLIEPMLKHIATSNGTSEGAEYLARCLFNNYEDMSLLVAKESGLPILQQMDEHTAAAMQTEIKTSIYSQRIILKCLCDVFERRIIILEKFEALGSDYICPKYGSIS